jgi:hypothetical protein
MLMNSVLGTALVPEDQSLAKRMFVHRFTGDNRPLWADGRRKPIFEDDAQWLANTYFYVKVDGRLDNRYNHCYSV